MRSALERQIRAIEDRQRSVPRGRTVVGGVRTTNRVKNQPLVGPPPSGAGGLVVNNMNIVNTIVVPGTTIPLNIPPNPTSSNGVLATTTSSGVRALVPALAGARLAEAAEAAASDSRTTPAAGGARLPAEVGPTRAAGTQRPLYLRSSSTVEVLPQLSTRPSTVERDNAMVHMEDSRGADTRAAARSGEWAARSGE